MTGHRRAVVTGGAGGIGGALCSALESSGHDVVSLDRRRRALRPNDLVVDLSDADQVRAAAAGILLGPCDVFVHSAADPTRATLADIDLTTWPPPSRSWPHRPEPSSPVRPSASTAA